MGQRGFNYLGMGPLQKWHDLYWASIYCLIATEMGLCHGVIERESGWHSNDLCVQTPSQATPKTNRHRICSRTSLMKPTEAHQRIVCLPHTYTRPHTHSNIHSLQHKFMSPLTISDHGNVISNKQVSSHLVTNYWAKSRWLSKDE